MDQNLPACAATAMAPAASGPGLPTDIEGLGMTCKPFAPPSTGSAPKPSLAEHRGGLASRELLIQLRPYKTAGYASPCGKGTRRQR